MSISLAATEGARRARGPLTLGWIDSPVGRLLLGAIDQGVCLLEFADREIVEEHLDSIQRRLGRTTGWGDHPHLDWLRDELSAYFAGTLREFAVPPVYPGTGFQVRVWDALRRIPYSETRSYEQLAIELGAPGAQRAVGHANGENPIAIVIPCHRVIAKDGGLGGYGGGLTRKRWLLELERRGVGHDEPELELT